MLNKKRRSINIASKSSRFITAARSIFLISLLLSTFITSNLYAEDGTDVDEIYYSNNDFLFYRPVECAAGSSSGSTTLVGNDRAEKVWNFLIGKGLEGEQAAGIMGNMFVETRQSPFDPSLEETANVAHKGYGLAQWTGGRRTHLEAVARDQKVPVSDMAFQLEFLYQESRTRIVSTKVAQQGYGTAGDNEWETLKKQVSIEDATVFWHNNFEVSNDSAASVLSERGGKARDIYANFKDTLPKSEGDTGDTSESTKATIFLDPGHGGAIPRYTDAESGLVTDENPNTPEREDAIDVANQAKAKLEADGYIVLLSHTGANDKVKFRDRVDAAAKAKASLAVSIHTTPGEVNQVWPQRVGTYREYKSNKVTFDNKETASVSQTVAAAFAKSRTKSEGHKVTTDPSNEQQAGSFNRDGIESKGNISLLQLWSTDVPWVYNEIAQDKGTAISATRKAAYAKGIVDGIEKSIPATKAATSNKSCTSSTGAFNGGDLAETTLAYAWPNYRGNSVEVYTNPKTGKKDYQIATNKAKSDGQYIGAGGIDCGAFVTRLLVNSGFEPKYNSSGRGGNTVSQREWAEKNWQTVGNGSSIKVGGDLSDSKVLRPGDVAFLPGHTFIYVGKIDGFSRKIASASLSTRAPMAGHESPTDGNVTWFRKK